MKMETLYEMYRNTNDYKGHLNNIKFVRKQKTKN